MKTLKLTLVIIAASAMFVACNDSQKDMAQQKVDNYQSFVDSVSNVATDKAGENWEAIESDYQQRKSETNTAVSSVTENTELQKNIDEATLKYEKFKEEVVAEHNRMETENSKMMMRQSLLGNDFTGEDMQFTWINKDNILGVYQNFVDTVDKNKDAYSREQWDEIKLLYEAIDTRKNTVEKEGLSSSDNRKIAALKLKFAPMYTVNRMGAKSDENATAKK